VFVAMYAATNLAGFAGPWLGGLMPRSGDLGPLGILSIASAILLTLAALLAAGVAIAPRLGEVPEPRDPPFTGRPEMGAGLLMIVALPATLVLTGGESLQYQAFFRSGDYATTWMFYVNPAAIVAASVLLCAAFIGAAF